jgi:NAD(P)-dependent dehydrogenase (short-subunit alcohol dehydrogenase family)
MERLCDHVLARHGVPDVVVNNAGIGVAGPFLETSIREWRRVLGINLMGVVHGCQLFGRAMVERGGGGHIVNIASAAAFQPAKDLAAYSASKAAVLMVSECLRAELGPHGIGVTAVCPGFIHTNITRTAHYVGQAHEDERRLAERVTRLYERRNFTPQQVAEEILRAIGRDRPVAVVTPEARVMRALSRFAPGLGRRLAQLDTLPA